jgi:hypothetical protein
MRTKTKGIARRVALVVTAFVVLVLGVSVAGQASASQSTYPWDSADIKNQSLGSVDLAPNSVGSSELAANSVGSADVKYNSLTGWDILNNDLTGVDVKDGSITTKDLSDATEATLKGNTGENGAPGKDGVIDPVYETSNVNVVKIGGKFADNATIADQFTLSAGKYMISTDALFRSNATTSGNADLQLAVRAADGTVWGQDLGTAFTGDSPVQANREVSVHTTRVVTIPADTTVTVYVFGYDASGEGSADSGLFDAEVYLTAVPVAQD